MVTLADETTEDEAEDLIDLTAAKQKRQWTVDATSQHSNHRLQHSPKVTFFDTGNSASSTRGEEKNDDVTDMSSMTPRHPRVSWILLLDFLFFWGLLVPL